MNRSAIPPPDDFRAGLRPPQFNLRFMLFGLTACCVLLAALRWLNPAAIVGVMLIVFSIIAHVVGNALGTQLQDHGNRKLPEDLPPGLAPLGQPLGRSTRRRTRPATPSPTSAAPTSAAPNPAAPTATAPTATAPVSAATADALSAPSASAAPIPKSPAGEVPVTEDPSELAAISAEHDDALSDGSSEASSDAWSEASSETWSEAWSEAAEFAPPSKLTQRESLGRVIYIAPVVTAVALATAGGFWLRHVVGAKATVGNMAFGIAAFAVLGCILGFLLGSFVKVLVTANLDAWRNGEPPP